MGFIWFYSFLRYIVCRSIFLAFTNFQLRFKVLILLPCGLVLLPDYDYAILLLIRLPDKKSIFSDYGIGPYPSLVRLVCQTHIFLRNLLVK